MNRRAASVNGEETAAARRWDTVALAVVALVARVPFIPFQNLVTYDGTSYLSEARALAEGQFDSLPGAFPIGYPAAAALLHLVARDWVVAGQLVSLLAAVGSTLLVYRLVVARAGRLAAIVAAIVLTLNPLFIRLSLQTMSESLYIFLVLLGITLALDRRMVVAGLALGAATATRPEGIAILGVVALFHLRAPGRLVKLVLPFLAVFAVNVAVLSASQGGFILLAKSNWLGSAARDWVSAERVIDYELPQQIDDPMEDVSTAPQRGLVRDYLQAMPKELGILARYAWPAVLLLAVWGIWRTGWHVLLAPLATLLVFTLFTKRQEDRYLLPYIPFLVAYAALGAAALRKPVWKKAALGALGACALGLLFVERAQVTTPEEPGLEGLKQAGTVMRDVIEPGERVADRKPHMAFYAGARYVEIPVAPYDDTIASLAADGVEWLSLHRQTIHPLRPALRPLMYSRAVINGELRYEQVFYQPAGEMVFRHRLHSDPLDYERLTRAPKADIMPAWSPDGEHIAFRRQHDDGSFSLMVASRRNRARLWSEDNVELVDVVPLDDTRDPPAWSPDGERVAFARRNTGRRTDLDLFAVDVYSGRVDVLVSTPADERSPSWPSPGRVVFSRGRPDGGDVWTLDPATGTGQPLTDTGACVYPTSSAGGGRVAWVRSGGGVSVLDVESGETTRFLAPRKTVYAPAWSPDGRTVAVSANDWGSFDVYLARSDGTSVLLLTKGYSGDTSPAWSPDGTSMVIVTDRGGTFSLWLLRGLDAYLERLDTEVETNVFTPLTERTRP